MGSLWPDFAKHPSRENASVEFTTHFDRHLRIDKITDHHPILEAFRAELRPIFRKTTPVMVDMLIDHHLARHWSEYHELPLTQFAQQTYQHLNNFNEFELPERLSNTLYWMQKYNWFEAYKTTTGISNAIEGMARRVRFTNPMAEHALTGVEIARKQETAIAEFLVELKSKL